MISGWNAVRGWIPLMPFLLGGPLLMIVPFWETTSVACYRSEPTIGRCLVRQSVVGVLVKEMPLSTIQGTSVKRFSGRVTTSSLVIHTTQGDFTSSAVSGSGVAEVAQQLEAFLHTPSQKELRTVIPIDWAEFILGFCLLGIGLGMLWYVAREGYS